MYDVIIIGAGVTGAATARELSRYKVNACVIEKETDVCSGTSKANSGIVHGGFDAKPGSFKARFNVEGAKTMKALSEELDFKYKNTGSVVVCTEKEDIPKLEALKAQGEENGVENIEVITDRDRIFKMEPNLSDDVIAMLYVPSAGIVCPFNLNIALAENAYTNGVEFKFQTKVENIERKEDYWLVETNNGNFETKAIVNAAGVFADHFHNMVSENKINITPRKGEYFLLDKTAGGHVNSTVFMLPGKFGKGVLVSQTVDGNLIVGPTAYDIEDKEGINTTPAGLDFIREKSAKSVKNVPLNQVITTFSGLRAHEDGGEFIVEEVADAENFFDCAGIESPGLSSCDAIGKYLSDLIAAKLELPVNPDFNPKRKGVTRITEISQEEYNQLIKEKPEYGQIICRCETVSEGEIVDAIHRPLGATDLDGIKRRTRAGAGRCQAGFCSSKVISILERELDRDIQTITKHGPGSEILKGITKK